MTVCWTPDPQAPVAHTGHKLATNYTNAHTLFSPFFKIFILIPG